MHCILQNIVFTRDSSTCRGRPGTTAAASSVHVKMPVTMCISVSPGTNNQLTTVRVIITGYMKFDTSESVKVRGLRGRVVAVVDFK